jgi:hypothetical protein
LENNAKSDLSIWIGTYTFEEVYWRERLGNYIELPIPYEMTIYEENGYYFADIKRDEPTLPYPTEIKSQVYGSEEWISLVAVEHDHYILSPLSAFDNVLLSLRRDNAGIYTYWGHLTPIEEEYKLSNKTHFKRDTGELDSINKYECDLSSWLGVYVFGEVLDERYMFYSGTEYLSTVTIYEENGDYFGIVERTTYADPIKIEEIEERFGSGSREIFVTPTTLQTKAFGSEEWISLTLLENLNKLDDYDAYDRVDDVLLSFRREKNDVYTYWGDFRAKSIDNIQSNKVYFEKAE